MNSSSARLLSWSLLSSLIILIIVTASLHTSERITTKDCKLDLGHGENATFTASLGFKAVSPVSLRIDAIALFNSSMIDIHILHGDHEYLLEPGEGLSLTIKPGEEAVIIVNCDSSYALQAPVPIVEVDVSYASSVLYPQIGLILVSAVGVYLVERRM